MDSTSDTAFEGPLGDISNQQASVITTWIIMTALAAVAVSMRFYTRRLILHILGLEDWLILAAVVFALGACVGFVRQTFFGMGRHVWTLTPAMSKQWQMEQFYSFLFYTTSLAMTKMSILCLYMRIMVYGAPRIAVYVVLGVAMLCNSWVLVASFIQCIPLQALWDSDVEGSCLGSAVALGSSIIHIITDFLIFVLPIPSLASLRIHKRQKIGLLVVFSIGFVVCLISILRIVSLNRLDYTDVPYQYSLIAIWGAIEVNLAIICACLTTFKPLVVRFFPNILGSSADKTHDPTTRTIGGGGGAAA